jgi:hypothetical protein
MHSPSRIHCNSRTHQSSVDATSLGPAISATLLLPRSRLVHYLFCGADFMIEIEAIAAV